MWYEPGHTLTHNALINMIIGPRGCGKTYGLKTWCIKRFIKYKEQFMYVRRYQDELDMVKKNLFDDTPYNIESDGSCYVMEKNIVGYCCSLSTSHKLKSASFPEVTTVVFDEFIIDTKKNQRYLKNEVDTFLNLLETIIRTRDNVRVFMLANSLSFVNPYTMYWQLQNSGKQFSKSQNGLVLCELFQDEEFKEMKEKTRFGQLTKGTQFADMSVDNKFILDSTTFIGRKTGNWKYWCGIVLEGQTLGVWQRGKSFFWDEKMLKDDVVFCVDEMDHEPGRRMDKKPNCFVSVIEAYKKGECGFSNIKVKVLATRFLAKYC